MPAFTVTLQDAIDENAVVELQLGDFVRGNDGPKGDKGDKGDTGDVTPSAEAARDAAIAAQGAAETAATNAAASAADANGVRADIANATDPAKGAALVGFDATLTYPNGSVGKQIALLLSWAYNQTFQLVSGARDSNGALTSATIKWPDGINGVFTTDVASTAFPGAIDAWHATYLGTTTKTVTQPLVTRDANGAVTVQPAITIS